MTDLTLFARAIRYQRIATENAFSVLSAVQHGSEDLLRNSLKYHTCIPEDGKKSCLRYADKCTQATETLRFLISKGFDQFEKNFSKRDYTETKKSNRPTAQPEKASPETKLIQAKSYAPATPSRPATKTKVELEPVAPKQELKAKPAQTAKEQTQKAAKPRTNLSTATQTTTASRTASKAPAKTTAKPATAKATSTKAKHKAPASKPKTTGTTPPKDTETQNPGT